MSRIKEQVKTLEPEKSKNPVLSEKRKRAMVEYMAIMFFVAFLLVLLSLLVQNRSLKQTTTENLNTSMTLQGRIENLQSENRELRGKLALALLQDAQQASQDDDEETFIATMAELEPYVDALPDEEKNIYEQLSQTLPAEEEETE